MKTRVLQFITGLSPGGAEHALARTIDHINKRKYEILICSITGGKLAKELRDKGYKVIVLGYSRVSQMPLAIKKLRKLIKEEKIDIIHSYLWHANMVARTARIGTNAKLVCSVRIKEIKRKHYPLIDAKTRFLVDKYTAVSEAVKNYMVDHGIPEKKIITVPNGLDFSEFKTKVNKKAKRKELKIPAGAKVITSVANLRKTKDYPTLLKAFKLVRKKHLTELLVIGKGDSEEEYKQIAKNLGIWKHVHFLGFRRDVKEILAISDVCVLSTHYEGMSNALLEYMAMKKPIVATDIKENREVIEDNKTGLLIPRRDHVLFAEGISKLLEEKKLASELVKNAYSQVKKKHDIKRVAKQAEKIYEELSNGK